MADTSIDTLRGIARSLRVAPGRSVSVAHDFDPDDTGPFRNEKGASEELQRGIAALADLQSRLAAQQTDAVLVVLQGLDASGKDGAIKHVMSGMNTAGVRVRSFKAPTGEELDHDYLWRHVRWLPERGVIGIFNRSHYEEVLAVRVHPADLDRERVPRTTRDSELWKRRYREINDWERYLVDNGTRVVKAMLHVSRVEQRERFLERIDDPGKRWKFSALDVEERSRWAEYEAAYSAMLSHTSTEAAPWHVVPADHKWFARLAVAAILVDALAEIDPRYPDTPQDKLDELARVRAELLAEKD